MTNEWMAKNCYLQDEDGDRRAKRVECHPRDCEHCGWNTLESERRREIIEETFYDPKSKDQVETDGDVKRLVLRR